MSGQDLRLLYRADASQVDSALDKIAQGHKAAEGKVAAFGSKLSDAGSVMTRKVTPAAGALAIASHEIFKEWDSGVDTIRAGTGATGKALEDLGASMTTVGGRVTQPLSEVGQVIAELNKRTGQSGKGLESVAASILDLSRITGTDAVPNVAAATRVFGDWSIKTKDQGAALDQLFRTSQATGVGITTLMERVVQFGAPMRELGFSFTETAALLGSFERAGVNTELVMGGLKQGLGRLAKAGKDPRAEIDALAASIDKSGLTAANKQKVFEIFGARAGIDMAKAIEEGRFKIADLIATVEGGSDTIAKASQDTLDWSDKFAMLRNKVTGALGPVAEFGQVTFGALAAVGPAMMGIGSAIPILGKLGPAFSSVGGLIGPLFANPIVLGIAAVVVATILIVKHWDKVKAALSAVWNFLRTTAGTVFGFLKELFLNFTPVGLIIKHWETIKGVISGAWAWIVDVTANAWNWVWDIVAGALNGIVDGVFWAANEIWRGVAWLIDTVWGWWSWLRDRIVGAWNWAWDHVVGAIRWVKDKVIEFVREVIGWFDKLPWVGHSPSPVEIHAVAATEGVLEAFQALRSQIGRELDRFPSLQIPPVRFGGRVAGGDGGGFSSPIAAGIGGGGRDSDLRALVAEVRALRADASSRRREEVTLLVDGKEVSAVLERRSSYHTRAIT